MWKWPRCPKRDYAPVTWEECLRCSNLKCHKKCFPLQLRRRIYEDLLAWKPVLGVYHVTELTRIRQAFYNRTRDYAATFDHALDLHIGKAFHEYLQKEFEPWVEIPVWRDFGQFRVIGYIDACSLEEDLLIDFKVYSSLYYIMTKYEGNASPDHEFQVRAYYTLAVNIADQIDKHKLLTIHRAFLTPDLTFWQPRYLFVWYFAKRRPDRKRGHIEFDRLTRCYKCPVKPLLIMPEIYERARRLHYALLTGHPPSRLSCPDWLCAFCPHWEVCLKRGEKDEFKPWKMWEGEIFGRKVVLENIPDDVADRLAKERGLKWWRRC